MTGSEPVASCSPWTCSGAGRRPRGPGRPPPPLARPAHSPLGADRRLPGCVRPRLVRAYARHCARTSLPASQRRTHRRAPGGQPRRAADRRGAGGRRRTCGRLCARCGNLRGLRRHPGVAATSHRSTAGTRHRVEPPDRTRGDPGAADHAHRRAGRQPCLRRRIRRSPAHPRSPVLWHVGLWPGARRAGGRGCGRHHARRRDPRAAVGRDRRAPFPRPGRGPGADPHRRSRGSRRRLRAGQRGGRAHHRDGSAAVVPRGGPRAHHGPVMLASAGASGPAGRSAAAAAVRAARPDLARAHRSTANRAGRTGAQAPDHQGAGGLLVPVRHSRPAAGASSPDA